MPSRKRKHPLTLTPTATAQAQAHPSSLATRTTISTFHTLLKRRKQLLTDTSHRHSAELQQLDQRLAALGGIDAYQSASKLGQSSDRGGDTSRTLVPWLRSRAKPRDGSKLRMLEIGALSPSNYASCSHWIENHPIDLHSQHPDIVEQDFFERPLPEDDGDRFDIISCSLVLNFVDDPSERGRMLFLMHAHLKPNPSSLLFMVLPLPCVENSRYLSVRTLKLMMGAVGFELVEEKARRGGRLAYWLWAWRERPRGAEDGEAWSRKRLEQERDGKSRNNFSILLPM